MDSKVECLKSIHVEMTDKNTHSDNMESKRT